MNWYLRIKKSYHQQQYAPIPAGQTWMDYGHDWWDKEDSAPYEPDDAIWAFARGRLNIVTSQEWYEQNKGADQVNFDHRSAFQNQLEDSNSFYGRYDAAKNVLTLNGRGFYQGTGKMPSMLERMLERRWPGAKWYQG